MALRDARERSDPLAGLYSGGSVPYGGGNGWNCVLGGFGRGVRLNGEKIGGFVVMDGRMIPDMILFVLMVVGVTCLRWFSSFSVVLLAFVGVVKVFSVWRSVVLFRKLETQSKVGGVEAGRDCWQSRKIVFDGVEIRERRFVNGSEWPDFELAALPTRSPAQGMSGGSLEDMMASECHGPVEEFESSDRCCGRQVARYRLVVGAKGGMMSDVVRLPLVEGCGKRRREVTIRRASDTPPKMGLVQSTYEPFEGEGDRLLDDWMPLLWAVTALVCFLDERVFDTGAFLTIPVAAMIVRLGGLFHSVESPHRLHVLTDQDAFFRAYVYPRDRERALRAVYAAVFHDFGAVDARETFDAPPSLQELHLLSRSRRARPGLPIRLQAFPKFFLGEATQTNRQPWWMTMAITPRQAPILAQTAHTPFNPSSVHPQIFLDFFIILLASTSSTAVLKSSFSFWSPILLLCLITLLVIRHPNQWGPASALYLPLPTTLTTNTHQFRGERSVFSNKAVLQALVLHQ